MKRTDFHVVRSGWFPMPLQGFDERASVSGFVKSWNLALGDDTEIDFHWSIYEELAQWMRGPYEPYRFYSWIDPWPDGDVAVLVAAKVPQGMFFGAMNGLGFTGGPTTAESIERVVAELEIIRREVTERPYLNEHE